MTPSTMVMVVPVSKSELFRGRCQRNAPVVASRPYIVVGDRVKTMPFTTSTWARCDVSERESARC